MQYDRTPRTGELTCFLAHRGPQLDLRPVGSFARPPPAPRRHSKQPDEEQEDDELCVVVYDLEDGEVGAEDEVEMAEAGGGEVEETEGIREIVVQNLPIPEPMRGPRKRRRPPREEWIVNQDLYRQQGAGGAQADADGAIFSRRCPVSVSTPSRPQPCYGQHFQNYLSTLIR